MKTLFLFLLLLFANFAVAKLEPCSWCNGSGTAVIFKPVTCQNCAGKGTHGICTACQGSGIQVLFAYRGPCYTCLGKGKQICYTCSATGTLQQAVPGGHCIMCKGKKQVTPEMNVYILQRKMAAQQAANQLFNPFYRAPEPIPDPKPFHRPDRKITLTCYRCGDTYTPIGLVSCPRCRMR